MQPTTRDPKLTAERLIEYRIERILRGRQEPETEIRHYINDIYNMSDINDYALLDTIGIFADFLLWNMPPNGFLEMDPEESEESYPNNIIITALAFGEARYQERIAYSASA